ncbi:MAG: hypothetical protein JWQ02_285 [Capsulimonas sp.]|nr:hypothetical protein [Capsulimonas sp.]
MDIGAFNAILGYACAKPFFSLDVLLSFVISFGKKNMKLALPLALHIGVAALALATQPLHACLNDRDTLAIEAQRQPDVLQAITGRFERNPPLYYQMRLTRVAKDLRAHPGNLDEYDDAAVACDRLGRDDEAIVWMNEKRAQLAPLAGAGAALKEEWYKYYANIGTCRVHRWIRARADRKHLAEVRKAHSEIMQAIKINPNAHFGREKYQQIVMEWLIDPIKHTERGAPAQPLWQYVGIKVNSEQFPQAATGFAGLIMLGNAWKSVDIFSTLASVCLTAEQSPTHLGYLAELRADELTATGHQSLLHGIDPAFDRTNGTKNDKENYNALRAEAVQWHAARTAYMIARLQAGRHPDTDPTFWADYHSSPPFKIPYEKTRPQQEKDIEHLALGVAIFIALLVITPIIVMVYKSVGARRRRGGQ